MGGVRVTAGSGVRSRSSAGSDRRAGTAFSATRTKSGDRKNPRNHQRPIPSRNRMMIKPSGTPRSHRRM
jgi:hypothetical protein